MFWLKIFAVSFALGVVSGIVMSFQFGTNWAELSTRAGNILGPLLAYEVLTAFFLEATFLGVMLFGWRRVSPPLHFLATCMVALGTLISTFWIISANSWMHTPAGYRIVDGVFQPESWWDIVFNPSFPLRLAHMTLAAFITTCFVIGGISATYLLRQRHREAAQLMLKLVGLLRGDRSAAAGRGRRSARPESARHQPMKLAAIEGTLGNGARRAADPVRVAGRGARGEPLRGERAEARQPDPHARHRRRGRGPEGSGAGAAAAGRAGVLRVSA